MTPEEVARERELVAAARAKMGDTSPVGNWMQGATRVVDALGAVLREKRTNKAEAAGLAGADEAIAALLAGRGGGFGGSAPSVAVSPRGAPVTPPDPNSPNAIADDTMAALGRPPMSTGADAEAIRAGLIARGLPEHVADGFLMNFQDESGLNPGINERNPIVPGSRGGFGLYQLTGPRRRAYEAFAAERGIPLDSVDGQLDFLMTELQGPESRAADAILSTKDAGTAGAAIVNEFLRPSPEYAAKRASEYLGGQPPTYDTAGGAPAVPGGTGGMDIASLLALQSDPWVAKKYGGVVDALMGQQFSRQNALWEQQQKMADPMYQAQLEMAQLELQRAQNPAVDPWAGTKEIGGVLYGPDGQGGFTPLITPEAEPGYAVMAPEEVAALGLPPGSYQRGPKGEIKEVGGGGVNVSVSNGASEVGTIPQGYELFTDPNTGARSLRPIAGGPEDRTARDAAATANKQTATDVITGAASAAREAAEKRAVGGIFGQLAAKNPGSQNAEVYRQVEVLKANASAENIVAMRAASPTGAALGGVSDKDLILLAAKSGALDPASPTFERDLDDYERTLLRLVHGVEAGDRIFEETRSGAGGGSVDFSQMGIAEIGQVDIGSLTPAQMDALEKRMTELGL